MHDDRDDNNAVSRSVPDGTSAARLAERGLRYALVDTASDAVLDAWLQADRRGFHAPAPPADSMPRRRDAIRGLRLIGVWDDAAPAGARPDVPIATTVSWPNELTVPGGALPMYAISSVTVAPTHSGRGIARAMVEGELRAASSAGFAIAGLTVSESTLYGRYGFGPAAMAAEITIETGRARWTGPEGPGTVVFVDINEAPALFGAVHERARLLSPGDVSTRGDFWASLTGADEPDAESTRARRFVVYREPDGEPTGAAMYHLTKHPDVFSKHTLEVGCLTAASDAAAGALWRYLLSVPLVQTVKAPLRPVDDPVRWLIGDFRAAAVTVVDHHWLRILDVPRALESRTYAVPGRLELVVRDALGFAAGRFSMIVDDAGRAVVARLADAPERDAGADASPGEHMELDAQALASLYLGGVSADVLARAGRLGPRSRGAVETVDRMFRTARAPWLSTWY
ncbi:UPF0256 protein [Pseudoclavibacter endophyticus]|uniref:GNAT family N-acetyltransferase n=1 Tax=Pseudoclavibacter endophyticus TaxID=1778590 RepID=A0A6H9WKL6_9MICO|nr:GNAT family N-acetyltransferase [Pseudoclavibacter endophyticus]KAB1649693.1 GNAT family N-acetyltransferase [Pseudoclavibacter endophyticus]GGA60529.1 UPF0256 protein [Pseudoclavibacter endophyticus]